MTRLNGRYVKWSERDSLLLPHEKTISANEWKRREREAFLQGTPSDPELIKISRAELEKIKSILED